MGALLSHLESLVAEERSEDELVRAVEDELTGGDLLDEELAQPGRVIAEAEARARTLDAAMLAAVQRGALYAPEELAELAVSRGEPGWRVRESLRFSCFAVLVVPLVERANGEGKAPEDVSSAVTELAQRLGGIKIHAPEDA